MPHDPRDDELCAAVTEVVAGLIVAHKTGDTDAIASHLVALLAATAKYASTERQRDDSALVRSLEHTR